MLRIAGRTPHRVRDTIKRSRSKVLSRILAMTSSLKEALASEARILGFDCVGVTDPSAIAAAGDYFRAFLDTGAHGDMDWLAARPERRADPRVLWPGVRSVIMLGVNYGPDENPLEILQQRTAARSRSTPRATIITM
jgi:epoxyqueuosine reductase QueG